MVRTHRRAIRAVALVAGAGIAFALAPGGTATAAPAQKGCDNRTNATVQALLECVRAGGAVEHLEAFQDIADANGGTRAAGTPGYEESVDYVVDTLEAAGWDVSIDEFPFTFVGPSTLQQLTPVNATYPTGPFTGSGPGDVTAAVIAGRPPARAGERQHQRLRGGRLRRLRLRRARHRAHPARHAAPSRVKAAQRRGGRRRGVIIFNQGNTARPRGPDRRHPRRPGRRRHPRRRCELRAGCRARAGRVDGAGLRAGARAASAEERHRRAARAQRRQRRDGGRAPRLGPGRPGHQRQRQRVGVAARDRQNLAKNKPQNTVRLAWWGAEEAGLIGSTAYVAGLSQAEKDRIALYLNFDMVASPNYIFMVYDGDESGFEAPVVVPDGSVAIEDLFESYFTERGRALRRRRVQRPQRLPGVHPQRHPGRWPLHRRRGGQDRGAGRPSGAVSPVSRTTSATTRRVTTSTTSTSRRSTSTSTRSRSPCWRTRTRPRP